MGVTQPVASGVGGEGGGVRQCAAHFQRFAFLAAALAPAAGGALNVLAFSFFCLLFSALLILLLAYGDAAAAAAARA